MRRTTVLAIAATLTASLVMTACGPSGKPAAKKQAPSVGTSEVNAQPVSALRQGGTLKVSLDQWISQYNSNTADGAQGDAASITAQVEPTLFLADAHGVEQPDPNSLLSAKVTSTWTSPHLFWNTAPSTTVVAPVLAGVAVVAGAEVATVGVVVAGAVVAGWFDAGVVTAAVIGIAIAAALWWLYFDVVALVAERRLSDAAPGREQNAIARDSFSFLHLPMIAGIVLLALGVKKALGHVGDPLHGVPAAALLGGVALYLLALWLIYVRSISSRFHWSLILVAIALVLAAAFTPVPILAIGIVMAGTVAIKVGLRLRDERTHEHATEPA